MGLNTPAIILNDQLHELERDPDAGAIIAHAVTDRRGDGWTPIGVSVGQSSHSSAMQVVAIGGNAMRTLGYGGCHDDDETLLRKLADRLGFRLVRKSQKRDDTP